MAPRTADLIRVPARPLRVVHLGKYYPPSPGGIETHTQTLARAQADLGADVRVLVINHASAQGRDATFDRLTRTPNSTDRDGPIAVTRVGRWGNLAKLDLAPGLPAALGQLLRDPPDVWHLHAPNPTMMLALLALPRVRPLVVTHHSDIVRQRALKSLFYPVERAIYTRAERIMPTSTDYARGSDSLTPFAGKLAPLPLGIDLGPLTRPNPAALALAVELRARHGSPLWLCVGRLIYYKGLDIALAALRDVPGKLLVVGTGPLEAALKARAAELGVDDRVIWKGHASADELAGCYRAATALWFPSTARSEGFGLVQVEAMASGCPVINTDIAGSGVAWVCRDGREGLTVPVGDAAALAAAALRLMREPGLRERLAAAGVRRAAAEFDARVMGERSLEIYEECLKR